MAPTYLLCDFSFPSYPRFREGTRLTHQQDNDNDNDDDDDDVCEHYQGKQIPFSPNRICGLCSTSRQVTSLIRGFPGRVLGVSWGCLRSFLRCLGGVLRFQWGGRGSGREVAWFSFQLLPFHVIIIIIIIIRYCVSCTMFTSESHQIQGETELCKSGR